MHNLIDHIRNYIWFIENLTCVLKVQRTCNSSIRFSKYIIIFILLSKVVANFVTKFFHLKNKNY